MTQRFDERGNVVPVTLIAAGPCTITQVKTAAKDGYSAVQLGFGARRRLSKPLGGHLNGLQTFGALKEFRVGPEEMYQRGQRVEAGVFAVGDRIEVEGVSKGRGFQGVVKRHGFAGHPVSHGHKDQTRMPGSIGSKRQGPVAPGKRMAGRMGTLQVTVKNLEVIEVDADKGIIAVKGAVPGARGGLVLISGSGEMKLESAEAKTAEVANVANAAIEPEDKTGAVTATSSSAAEAPGETPSI